VHRHSVVLHIVTQVIAHRLSTIMDSENIVVVGCAKDGPGQVGDARTRHHTDRQTDRRTHGRE
jgi:hypothetical protein